MAHETITSRNHEDVLEVLRETLEEAPPGPLLEMNGHLTPAPTEEEPGKGERLPSGAPREPSRNGGLAGKAASHGDGWQPILRRMAIPLALVVLALGGILYRDRIQQSPLAQSLGGYAARVAQEIGLKAKPAPHPAGHGGEMSTTPQEGQEANGRRILYYYDPMHPEYKSDKPGIAPDCGMKLVPMYAEEAAQLAQMPPGTVMLGPEKRQLIGVRTASVQVMSLERTIQTVGRLTYDETRIARVHTKVPGWIEKIYVDFEGQPVKQGDALFSLYSQDLVATQEEYLIALKGYQRLSQSPFGEISRGARSLLESTKRRLELWDITDSQIEELARTGKVRKTLTLYSPVNGIVLKREAYAQQMITPEMSVYTIADVSKIWVLADIYEYEFPFIRVGQPATMTMPYFPGKTFRGKITYLYPYMEGETRTLKARVEFANPDLKLRPDMYADIAIQAALGRSTVVPEEAVLDSGERKIVFVDQGGGYFEPREVRLGVKLDDAYQVLAGLAPGEVVVTSGNFLLDSESRLASATGGVGHAHGGSTGGSVQPEPQRGGGSTHQGHSEGPLAPPPGKSPRAGEIRKRVSPAGPLEPPPASSPEHQGRSGHSGQGEPPGHLAAPPPPPQESAPESSPGHQH